MQGERSRSRIGARQVRWSRKEGRPVSPHKVAACLCHVGRQPVPKVAVAHRHSRVVAAQRIRVHDEIREADLCRDCLGFHARLLLRGTVHPVKEREALQNATLFFSVLPYVSPEPVLVKGLF